jgi:hypothetical protein
MKQWTILAYLAGDNNLDSAGVEDMAEMAAVGSTPNVDVVVQFDRAGKKAVTARYHVSKGGGCVEKDRVMVLPETNTGDPQVLIDFIAWGIQNYPAQHYLLVVWNHGSGWSEDNVYRHTKLTRRALPQPTILTHGPLRSALFSTTLEEMAGSGAGVGIAYDDANRDFLDNAELKKCLQAAYAQTGGRKVDVLGFDACLMNMVEVVYQLKDTVAITVGSEETEPGAGWPYGLILDALAKKPSLTPVQLGQTIVQKYYQSYLDTSEAVTQSALNLARIDGLAAAVDKLADALLANLTTDVKKAIAKVLRACQRFYYPDYLDLYDLARLLKDYTTVPAIKTAAQGVMSALRTSATKGFIVANKRLGSSVARARGISIYFPRDAVSPFYKNLDYAAGHRWDEFLKAYHKTRLQPERRKGRGL